jgi:hypothetical protein
MLVAGRAVAILAVFFAAGFPLTALLLQSLTARVLLAPAAGLALLAVFSSLIFALGWPVSVAPLPFAILVVALWIGSVWKGHVRFEIPRPCWRTCAVVLGLLGVVTPYVWPTVQNSSLVFWHYAGSDGYMYMSLAEQFGMNGRQPLPDPSPYDAASSFAGEVIRVVNDAAGYGEKVGTFAVHAALAKFLGLTTQETFLPLVVAVIGALYLALLAFGRSVQLGLLLALVLAGLG